MDGEQIWYEWTTQNAFQSKTTDESFTWKRGATLEVQIRCDSTGGQAEMRNFQICGIQSPIILD